MFVLVGRHVCRVLCTYVRGRRQNRQVVAEDV